MTSPTTDRHEYMALRNEFLEWWAMVHPAGCSPVQFQEQRRAFYAGAFAMWILMSKASSEEVSEDDGVQRIEALYRECDAFIDSIGTKEEG